MDFVTPLYRTLQAGADLDKTRATAADTNALAQGRMYALNQNMLAQQTIADMMSKQQAAPPQQPPNMFGGDAGGAIGAAMSQVGKLETQAQSMEGMAKALAAIKPDLSDNYMKMAADVREKMAKLTLDANKQQSDLVKRVGGIAGAIQLGDDEGLRNGLRQMAMISPGSLSQISIDTDQNGQPIASERTYKSLQNYANQSLSRAEQETSFHRIATEKLAAVTEQRRADDAEQGHLLRKDISDQSAALRQQGQSIEKDRLTALDQNRATVNAERLATDYERDSKDIREKVPFVQNAMKYLFNEDGTRKPASQTTPAQDKGLMETYVKIVFPDYKGSVYDKKSVENLTGLPQRFVQGIENIFGGQRLPDDVRDDMWKSISSQFKEMNDQQIQREDNYAQRAQRARIPNDLYSAYIQPYALRPTGGASAKTLTATNPTTGEKRKSTDGGKTWQPM